MNRTLEEESCSNGEEKLEYVALKDWGLPVMSRLREVKTILW